MTVGGAAGIDARGQQSGGHQCGCVSAGFEISQRVWR
jgi:hypothetical protein